MCEKCGREHNATRQLVNGSWKFRRSGLLGIEKNAQGAVPVALTLQQLETTLHGASDGNAYSPSLELTPQPGKILEACELDFVWVRRGPHWKSERTIIVLGECKDRWVIDDNDIEHLRQVADALPPHRFEVFVLLAKLCPFSEEEIARAKTLNGSDHCRVILLTARELEPYSIFERTKKECKFTERGHDPEDLALATAEIYFRGPPVLPPPA
jgi:hypothetical protein